MKPFNGTPTGATLEKILDAYMRSYKNDRKTKKMNIICITDGAASDPSKLMDVLIDCSKKLDNYDAPLDQVGIQFFQVGNDKRATYQLEHLDNMQEEGRDIVDTYHFENVEKLQAKMKTQGISIGDQPEFSGEVIIKIVLGAIRKDVDANPTWQ